MNKVFEMPTRPILEALVARDQLMVSKTRQKKLSAWIFKTLTMSALVAYPQFADVPNAAIARLRQTSGRPFANARLWIGQHGEAAVYPEGVPEQQSKPEMWSDGDLPHSNGLLLPNLYIVMWVSQDGRWPAFMEHPWWGTFIRQVFPFERAFEWPLNSQMDAEIIATITTRW